ncbi:MAG: type III pantothenate kinase [Bacilli bacterium]|nr:type III pantothenate kinase [Bacilli bacterium]MDD4520446.1 type III pantothenate kinase [Bacilli bacterium]HKM11212.1 type III pantothenate kinase [Bacilli bacterium]
MILTVDLGNTAIHLGFYQGDTLVKTWATSSDLRKEKSEYLTLFKRYISDEGIDPTQVQGGILSSVVPPLTNVIKEVFEKLFDIRIQVVGRRLKTGLAIHIDKPDELGADLVASAVGAKDKFGFPLLIIDLGTANKISIIDQTGAFIGAVFTSGLRVSIDALIVKTAQLPHVSLERPTHVIGRNTIDAMNSGATYGTASMLTGLIGKIEQELGYQTKHILLGGNAPFVRELLADNVIYAPDLQHWGLKLIYDKNFGERSL